MICSAVLVLGGCHPPASVPAPRWQACSGDSLLVRNQRLGVVGCTVDGGTGGVPALCDGLSGELSDELIGLLVDCGRFRVVDRTRLQKVLAEHALTLSGLLADTVTKINLAVDEIDYLCELQIRSPRVSVTSAVEDPGFADTPLLVRGTARCQVVLELVDLRSAQVAWSQSREASKQAFADSESQLDSRELLRRCALDGLQDLVASLRCAQFPAIGTIGANQ